MSSPDQYVINEWILDYLKVDADKEDVKTAIKVLENLGGKGYQFQILKNSPWEKKLRDFDKEYLKRHRVPKSLLKPIFKLILDSNRFNLLEEAELEVVPNDLLNRAKDDDFFLIKLAYSTKMPIVTTDEDLIKAFEGTEIKLIHKDDFLKKYF